MIKRVNFTGRRRIPQRCVDIEVFDGQPRTFDAKIDLTGMSFLPHAAMILEAMCAGSTVINRYEFGEVGNISPPANRSLTGVEGENVFFTLKVVDRTERFGRLLGVAEQLRPQRAGKQTAYGRRGILPVEPADLGQELWRLSYKDRDVHLLVNSHVPGLVDRVRSDPQFHAFVYPQVIRDVLMRAIAENVDIEEEDDRWPILWLRFGKNLHPAKEKPPQSSDNRQDQEEWVEEVVQAFCASHVLRDKYLSTSVASSGGEL